MATPIIKHSVVTGAPSDPRAIVDGPAWDATHIVTGLENVPNVDTTNASNITSGTLAITQGGTGRNSASAAFDALSPTTMRGDIIFRNATTNTSLAAGTAGYFLQTNGAGADPSYAGFLQAGTGAVTRVWQDKVRETFFSVKDFGAVGDNTADDTTAIQNAVNAAQALPKGIVFFPSGTYKITSSINITSGINLRGVGFMSPYKPGVVGSTIALASGIIGFNITTDDSVTIEKLQFIGSGLSQSVVINTDNSTSVKSNYQSVLRDCMFIGGARGINGVSILDFTFDNCDFYNITNTSCQVEAPNSLGNGDSIITNCTFSGGPTGGHVKTGTIGGLRIENNKFNCQSSANAFAIVFQTSTVSALGMSPIIITGNSIEGVQYGILFQRTGSGTMTANNIVISANEILVTVAGGFAINSQTGGGNANAWVLGGVISGNFFYAAQTGITLIQLDGAQDINIASNQFMTNQASATAVGLGATTARISQIGNVAGLNVSYNSVLTNSLGADVLLNNTANYFDGPSVAQGTNGTWFVSGTVSVVDTGGAANIRCRLWDGTTVIASADGNPTLAGFIQTVSLSGVITNPTGNLRISCQDVNAATGKILFNNTTNAKDSTITAIRIA